MHAMRHQLVQRLGPLSWYGRSFVVRSSLTVTSQRNSFHILASTCMPSAVVIDSPPPLHDRRHHALPNQLPKAQGRCPRGSCYIGAEAQGRRIFITSSGNLSGRRPQLPPVLRCSPVHVGRQDNGRRGRQPGGDTQYYEAIGASRSGSAAVCKCVGTQYFVPGIDSSQL